MVESKIVPPRYLSRRFALPFRMRTPFNHKKYYVGTPPPPPRLGKAIRTHPRRGFHQKVHSSHTRRFNTSVARSVTRRRTERERERETALTGKCCQECVLQTNFTLKTRRRRHLRQTSKASALWLAEGGTHCRRHWHAPDCRKISPPTAIPSSPSPLTRQRRARRYQWHHKKGLTSRISPRRYACGSSTVMKNASPGLS